MYYTVFYTRNLKVKFRLYMAVNCVIGPPTADTFNFQFLYGGF